MNAAFGLAKIQEAYQISWKKSSKIQQEIGKPSILGFPKVNTFVDAKSRIPIKRISLAQMEERKKKGLCYTVMKNGALVISVKVPNYSFLKVLNLCLIYSLGLRSLSERKKLEVQSMKGKILVLILRR